METLDKQIKDVFQKLKVLLKKYEGLQKENDRLHAMLKVAVTKNESDDLAIQKLTTELGILKSSANTLVGAEKIAFETQIGSYIKSIEKCISILNK